MRLRLGVNLIGSSPTSWLDDCRRVEAAGIDELSVADHLVEGAKSPLVALAAAAAVTTDLGLSTMVLNNELRHPGVLAAEAAFVQELSGGRLVLGMGAGYARAEHDAIGLPLPPVDERMDRLAASVAALRSLLQGNEVTADGPYPFAGHRTWPPTNVPVPILVGGGSARLIEVAARHADVVGFTGFSVVGRTPRLTHFSAAGLDGRLAMVRAAAGDRAPALRFQVLVQHTEVTDDREAAAAALAAQWREEGQEMAVDDVLGCPFLLLGTVAEIAAQMRAAADRWGIGTWTTFSGRPDDVTLDQLGDLAGELRR